ncbi:MAG: molecular chaperone DnaJ [Candidatus Geothermarchaeales archaeon]
MGKRDYYEILGLERDASPDQLKSSYRKLALKYHPDRNKEPEAEAKFKEISEAYAVLSDEEKRGQYDRFGHAGIDQRYSAEDIFRGADFGEIFRSMGMNFGFGGLRDIFEDFFGMGGGGRSARQHRGGDLKYEAELTLEEAAAGLSKGITGPRIESCGTCQGQGAEPGTSAKSCPKCNGTGQVQMIRSTGFTRLITMGDCSTCGGNGKLIEKPCHVCRGEGILEQKRTINVQIPAGVDEGHSLRLRGEGDASPDGGPPGDLYVVIHVKPHRLFEREGDDLLYKTKSDFPDVALGGEIKVPTLDGSAVLKIPSGTQSGTVFRIKGKGMQKLNGFGRGHLYVQVDVVTPSKLTSKQKKLLQDLSKEFARDSDP